MEIVISGVEKYRNLTLISFDSLIGTGKGICNATNVQSGKCYDVEFEIKDDVNLDGNAVVSTDHRGSLWVEDDVVFLNGFIEDVDKQYDYNIAYLRLSENSLTMIETNTLHSGIWVTIRITVDLFEIYPTGI